MTKEEIIRNLKYTMEKHKNDTVSTFDTNISVMCKDILDYLEQEPKMRWISVTERLPEKKVKDYLACCEDGYVATIMYDNGRWLINGNNVIAWMPKPEPYKAERGE